MAVDDYGFTQGAGPGQGCATGPGTCFGSVGGANRSYLGTLVQQAYQKLASEQGRAAADAAFAELWELHQEAFAIRSDRGGFVEAMQAAHAESVKLVLQVLGNDVAAAVIDLAAARLEALKAAIAASGNAARLQYLADRVAGYLADAQARLAARDYAGALDLGSRALQAATVGAGQTVRGASAGTGIGAGGGRQYRGGK
ncbi:MAG: hypothetical protein FIB01_00930 [Gemmatimonadetes bacterium]|nr:hypothetical protein [Gemmatimonadota bacterium]